MRASRRGDFADAESRLQAAVRCAERLDRPDERLACSLFQLARLNEFLGRKQNAERLYRRALEVEERALGPDHPYVAMIMRAYAHLLRRVGRTDEATCLETRASAIWSGDTHGHLDEWTHVA